MKKCKGHYPLPTSLGCGKEKLIFKYGLCQSCFMDWCKSTEEGREWVVKMQLPKAKKELKREKKEKEKKAKDANRSIASHINSTRVPFQKYIRIRDANDGCISCGTTTAKIYHAGHYFKAETYRGMIFDEINVNKQCEKCNTFLNGNESGYRLGLVEKYGEDVVLKLEERANVNRTHEYTREGLKELRTLYNAKIKEITKTK